MGRKIAYFLEEVGGITSLFWQIILHIVRPPFKGKYIISQMLEIGVNTLPIASIMAVFTGMVLAVQTYIKLREFNAETVVGGVVAASMCKELGPVLTAIIVAGRIGSSTTAEIGSMKVTEQIDALETLAVNPIKQLACPRFIASLIMLPCLTIYTDLIGILGGYAVGVYRFSICSSIYVDNSISFVSPWDILSGLIKAFFFGMIIIVIGCYKGFTTIGGAKGVGKATTSSVVISSILILVSNYFLTVLLYQ
ncbi:MAG: ABC transporter permease [bacterium]|nr:ABC transporter permease [bacterium]